ncbi:MAG: hypothetical protein NFCOHLIN_01705 [Gammaproteobacteria bacterium]|nr:hypothetical protein [Gammaproteobacteria bacterium]
MDIVYIEASTLRRWNLDEFAQRTGNAAYRVESRYVYDFDKTAALAGVMGSRARIPDTVIIQECSAYFPGDLVKYKDLFRDWIRRVKDANAIPVIATTVPPAANRTLFGHVKQFVKLKILGRADGYEQIIQFNQWLRELSEAEGVPLFDVEKVTRKSESDRHMRVEFDSGDGSHLNPNAYAVLDREFLNFLETLKP